jgi:AhpD family alkylhydroperoxidase
MSTTPRLNYYAVAGDAMATIMPLARFVHDESGLDAKLLNLVQLRASQINGCAFCTILHANDARDDGDTDDRLHALAVWHETPYFSETERVALEWTEKLTRLPDNRIDDDLYARGVAAFGDRGIVMLTLAIAAINVWNRFGVAFQSRPNAHVRTKALLAQ